MTEASIRRARPDEAALLSGLALRSKAYWGYDAAFMAACRDDLTLTPEALTQRPHYLLEIEGQILGFYNLSETPGGVFLQNLMCPQPFADALSDNLRRDKMEHEAEALGYAVIFIESDPYAEPFYLARGAERVGSVPSSVLPGRALPLLRFDVCTALTPSKPLYQRP